MCFLSVNNPYIKLQKSQRWLDFGSFINTPYPPLIPLQKGKRGDSLVGFQDFRLSL
jgi:hypothetical protein